LVIGASTALFIAPDLEIVAKFTPSIGLLFFVVYFLLIDVILRMHSLYVELKLTPTT
jgi:hypothetical protein